MELRAQNGVAGACQRTRESHGPNAGHSVLYPPAVDTLIREFIDRADRRGTKSDLLTASELEVLKLIAEGHTSKEIASMLVISIKTVDRHRANMLEKLGMHDRVDLTRHAIRPPLIEA